MSDQEILAAPALRGARPRRPEASPEEIELFEPPQNATFHKACFMCALLETVPEPDYLSCLTKGK